MTHKKRAGYSLVSSDSSTTANTEKHKIFYKPVTAGSIASQVWRGGDLHHLGRYFLRVV